jgi:carboxypeptidase Taq
VEARKASDFSKFAPFLQQWVEVNQQKAKYIDPNTSAYDVLLDDYEKNMTSARLDEVFTQVRSWALLQGQQGGGCGLDGVGM